MLFGDEHSCLGLTEKVHTSPLLLLFIAFSIPSALCWWPWAQGLAKHLSFLFIVEPA